MSRLRSVVTAVALCCLLAGPSFAQDSPQKAIPSNASGDSAIVRDPRQGEYLIGPEDILDILVWKNPELSRTVPVRPDGKVSLPLVNDIQAAGLTPSDLRQQVGMTYRSARPESPSPKTSARCNTVRRRWTSSYRSSSPFCRATRCRFSARWIW